MESPFTMVVLIVAICVAGSVLRARLAGRPVRDEAAADPMLRADNAQLQEEIRQLKRRVATLERIATDGAAALDREIESLRDRP